MYDIGPIILGVVSLVMVALAWQVRSGATWMLSGYRAERVSDERGLAAWCGNGLLLLGFVSAAFAFACAAFPTRLPYLIAAYLVTIGAGVLTIASGARRFLNRD